MITLKLYTTAAEIDTAVVLFHAKGQKLQTEAHRLACSVLRHVGEHGDVRVVLKFIQALPEMSRRNAVKAWFEHFGPVKFDGEEITFVKGGKTRLGDAMEAPFWKFSPEPAYKPIDVAEALEALIKKLVKDAGKTNRSHAATIAALRAAPVNSVLMIEHRPH
jgi:hypothetical protein